MFSFVESVDDVKECKSEGDRGANISVRVRSSRLSLVARDVLTSRATQERNMKCPFGKPLINSLANKKINLPLQRLRTRTPKDVLLSPIPVYYDYDT